MKKIKEYAVKILSVVLIIFAISFALFEEVRTQTISFILRPIFEPLFDDMLREDEERQRRIANGEKVEMITGKDTVLEWGNIYYIMKEGLENQEVLHIEKGNVLPHILEGIIDYSLYEGKLYIVSKEGYAVIDKNNQCKVFIFAPFNDFMEGKEYGINSKGEKMFYSGKVESEYIVYLNSFSEYSETEQNKLNKMLDKIQAK